VGNYPGVTVEIKSGKLFDNVEVIDLPGAYSLSAHSPDQMVVANLLGGKQEGERKPDLLVVIIDAANVQRNTYLVTQLLELGIPAVVALNMIDAAERTGVTVDREGLSRALGVPVIETVANKAEGMAELKEAIVNAADQAPKPSWTWPEPLAREIRNLAELFNVEEWLAARALIDVEGIAEQQLGESARDALKQARERIQATGQTPAALEARMRYAWIERSITPHVKRSAAAANFTQRLDGILIHRLWGTIIFAAVMTLIFMAIFQWAAPIMDGIDAAFSWIGDVVRSIFAGTAAEGGMLESLLVDGIIAGSGSVLIFLPQIVILFLFIAILEDCGYMARAAFLMDRLLRFCGLSGHSFIPLMSSFTCAIPGVMATRTIADPRDRLVTILVAPLMSCSARIPVYAMLTAAFVPAVLVAGFLPLQGLVFASMYFVGILVAIPVALILKKTVGRGAPSTFVMELPSYQWPGMRTVLMRVWLAVREFIIRAGTIILAISIVIWALSYFPHSSDVHAKYEAQRQAAASDEERQAIDQAESGEHLRNSIFGRIGRAVEPAVQPLGWDWRIGMAVIASFPAREVIVSTLRITYDLGEEGEDESLAKTLQASTWPDGRPVFNLAVALSIMVFFALCLQCGATVAVIRRETNSWKWAGFAFVYMTALAYVGALATYQIGSRL
jgi:ferrous iron transport protein B